MRIEQDINYRTTDRGLAAAFMALGLQLRRIEPADRGATFLFTVSQELLDTADAYLVDALAISARRMAEAMERLEEVIKGRTPKNEVIDLDTL